MNEPPSVQYATTPDGKKIAYAIAGEGQTIVHLPFHYNHVSLRWTGPLWFRGLADHYRVIHYDSRGQGLSTRGLESDVTTAELRMDLETVLNATGVERFALVAYGGFGHVAARYAAEHPERVSALVLICTSESFEAWSQAAHLGVAQENWDLFLELQTRKAPPDIAHRVIAWFKQMATKEDYVHLVSAFLNDPDISHILPKLTIPALLLHSLDQHWLPPAEGAKLAGKLPDARILFTDGDVEPDDRQAVPAIVSFLQGVLASDPIGPHPSGERVQSELSRRQIEVLQLIAEGKRTREIAEALVLSERTVERHIADVYTKIGARNRSEATAFALSRLVTT